MADVTDELMLPPCKVCGGKSSGRHFGVLTCEACKSFFKRHKNRDKPYRCRGVPKGTCAVKTGLGYPICPYCRYQACIMVGMSREGIDKGRFPIELKTELLLQAKQYQEEAKVRKEKEREADSKQKETVAEGKDRHEGAPDENTCSKEADAPDIQESLKSQYKQNGHDEHDLTYTNNFDHSQDTENIQYENDTNGFGISHDLAEDPFYLPEIQPAIEGEFMSLLTDTATPTSEAIWDTFSPDKTLYPETSSHSMYTPEASPPKNSIFPETAYLERLVQTLIDVDAAYSLYDPEEIVDVQKRIEKYVKTREAKAKLLGELHCLPHDVYTEVYESTGIDIDDYRHKILGCITDMKLDIDIFLDYIRNIPRYKDLNLNDRTLLVKGGFPGWTVLSSISNYNCDFDIWACNTNMIYSTNDFINYYGKLYSKSIRSCLTILQHNHVTTAELAILKAMHIFKERPQVGKIEDVATLDELQMVLHEALQYVLERDRGPEEATVIKGDLMEASSHLEGITVSFLDNVKNWPIKFPEYSCPRILLEMVGAEAEEELLVAVSVQLNIND